MRTALVPLTGATPTWLYLMGRQGDLAGQGGRLGWLAGRAGWNGWPNEIWSRKKSCWLREKFGISWKKSDEKYQFFLGKQLRSSIMRRNTHVGPRPPSPPARPGPDLNPARSCRPAPGSGPAQSMLTTACGGSLNRPSACFAPRLPGAAAWVQWCECKFCATRCECDWVDAVAWI